MRYYLIALVAGTMLTTACNSDKTDNYDTSEDTGGTVTDTSVEDSGTQSTDETDTVETGEDTNDTEDTDVEETGGQTEDTAGEETQTEPVDTGDGSQVISVVVDYSGSRTALPPNGTSGTLVTSSKTAPTGTIVDLNVAIDLDHTCTKDLSAVLESPSGTSVVIFDLGGMVVCSSDIENTVLDDEASVDIINGSSPFNGPHQPSGSLARFDGEDAAGVWILTITDDTPGDSGRLHSWSLEFMLK